MVKGAVTRLAFTASTAASSWATRAALLGCLTSITTVLAFCRDLMMAASASPSWAAYLASSSFLIWA